MTREDDEQAPPAKPPPKAGEADAREARLAQALRANLRRHKASGRGDEAPPPKGR